MSIDFRAFDRGGIVEFPPRTGGQTGLVAPLEMLEVTRELVVGEIREERRGDLGVVRLDGVNKRGSRDGMRIRGLRGLDEELVVAE